jgi:small-conductance mechanosensitive channel
MKRFFLLCALIPAALWLPAQRHGSDKPAAQAPDSTVVKKEVKHTHRKMVWASDTLTESDYMLSFERVNDRLNTIRDSVKLGFEEVRFQRRNDGITADLNEIRQYMGGRRTRINLRNLYLYQNFLSDLSDDNKDLHKQVNVVYNRFYRAKIGLKTAMNDSVFKALNADTAMKRLFDKKLIRMQMKWMRTDSLTKAGLSALNDLKVKISDNSINLSNMLNMLDNRLDRVGMQLFGKETNYLWQPAAPDSLPRGKQPLVSAITSEQRAMGYYIAQTSGQRVALVLMLAVLLFWWMLKRRRLKLAGTTLDELKYLNISYLKKSPVWALLAMGLCFTPLFDAYAPTSYITCEYVLLLAIASVIFFHRWQRPLRRQWLILAVLFPALALTYLFAEPGLPARLWLLLLHAGLMAAALLFCKSIDRQMPYARWMKITGLLSACLALLALAANIFGRFSLAGILGLTASIAVTQAAILPVFVDTLLEMILLQIQSSRLRKGIDRPFETSIVAKKLQMPLLLIAFVLWGIMFTSDLNVYHAINNGLGDFFGSARSVGSISFKLSSVLLFIVIIWAAHILQRLISFLFGETGNEIEDITAVSKGQHSRLLITRLIVLCGGYLLAVAASGLPIDKITIVLGALGVGIGMGLQSIVNNFVSGIILIFDGSLKIGDDIEVSGQTGKVKEIGLRASTINTADGAEVIIPNGNILSQNIVNWTFSNDQRRAMIEFSLSGGEPDTNLITEVINEVVLSVPGVIVKKKTVILFTRVQQNTCTLTVRFWTTMGNVEQVKSESLLRLNRRFAAEGLVME